MLLVVWLALVIVPPFCVVALERLGLPTERLRAVSLICAGLMLVAASGTLAVPELGSFSLSPSMSPWASLRVDQLSAPLVPFPAALWLITVAVTPRARLERAGLPRTAMATSCTTIAFLTESPALLVLLWCLSSLLFLLALRGAEYRRVRRVAIAYLGASASFLLGGVLLAETAMPAAGSWLILAAVLTRKGIFPFHAWIPEAFDEGKLGPAVLFSAPQLGTYVAAVLVVPHAGPGVLRLMAILAVATAVYGAALALVQRDARRACGYLFVSQSALVLAGLGGSTPEAMAGSLVLWISSGLAFTGMARTVLVLEARRGRLDLRQHHGGYEQMPLLAACFLVLGLACTGFPGTLGFIGEELLIEGATHELPVFGFMVVLASSFTGLAVLRMYFSLFCGARSGAPRLPLLRREAIVFGTVASLLMAGGLAPGPIVSSRLRASDSVLAKRAPCALFEAAR